MSNSLEFTSEDAYKVYEWSDGYYFGISCIYISSLNIVDITKGEDKHIRDAFHNILNEIHHLKNVCQAGIELLYLTTPAENQAYRADIRIFLVLRLLAESKDACDTFISVNTDMICKILSSHKISFKHVHELYLNKILEPLRYYNAGCLIKQEEIIPSSIPLSQYYYSVDYIKSSYNAEAYRSFMHQLSNYPNVAVSFSLMPNVFDYDEEDSIMRVSNLLERVTNGFMDEYYGEIIDYNARESAERYNYIFSKINEPTFRFNISVYCKIKMDKVAEQKWTKLHVHFGHYCNGYRTGSQEWCSTYK